GMYPYLEHPAYWPDFHARFINSASEQVGLSLPDTYDARIEESVRLVTIESDLQKSTRGDVTITRDVTSPRPPGGTTATTTMEPVVAALPKPIVEEVRETRVQILRLPDR